MNGLFDQRRLINRRAKILTGFAAGVASTLLGSSIVHHPGTVHFPSSNSTALAVIPKRTGMPRRRASRFGGRRVRRRMRGRGGRRPGRFLARTRTRRGNRYTRFGARRKALNTNLSRNDRRSIRAVTHLGEFGIVEGVQLTNTGTHQVSLDDFSTWSYIKDNFTEFKMTNVQFVIQPRSIKDSHDMRVATTYDPFLAVRVMQEFTDTGEKLVDWSELRQTPGIQYVPILSKKRMVINVKPKILEAFTMVKPGTNVVGDRYVSVPWLSCSAANQTGMDVAGIQLIRPVLDAHEGAEAWFDIKCYATLHYRGEKVHLLAPDD